MQTTVCAYCDHEVKITPDGTCLYCGGNLAEETIDEERDNRMARIRKFIIGEPIVRKSRSELYAPYRKELGKSGMETNLQSIRRTLEREKQQQKESQLKKEIKELDTFTSIVSKSDTIKTLQKAIDQPIFPRWFKFVAFLIGLGLSSFYSFPFLQVPILEMFSLINNSPITIMAMSVIPIIFLLMIMKKFDRGF